MEEVKKAASRQRAALLALPNVVGVGVGYKQKGGEKTVKPAVVVMVRRKVPKDELAPQHLVPEKVEGVPTDVVEVGDLKPLAREPAGATARKPPKAAPPAAPQVTPADQRRRTARLRPAPPGVSIGHYKISAGTLGAIVYDSAGHPFILSNNHVLANSTTGKDHRAKLGDAVLQPGPADGGRAADGGQTGDTIGVLERYVPIKPRQTNLVDAALAKPRSKTAVKDEILGLGRVTGVAKPRLGMAVRKSGRTTGVTAGFIEITDATVRINYDDALVSFGEQIILSPMSAPGDSGSLVVDERNRAVGLLFAGSEQSTVCSPIDNVLSALKVGFAAGQKAAPAAPRKPRRSATR